MSRPLQPLEVYNRILRFRRTHKPSLLRLIDGERNSRVQMSRSERYYAGVIREEMERDARANAEVSILEIGKKG